MKTSLIIPAYNEEKALGKVIDEALDKVDEIIIVDDGSTDNTAAIAENYSRKFKKVKFIKHLRNFGKVRALHSGVENASCNNIIFTDADFTYPACYFPVMIQELKKGADLVLGSRFKKGINNMQIFNRIGNKIFSIIATYITCISVTDGQTGLRAFRKNRFKELDVKAKSLEYETKMTVRAAKLGYKITEIPIKYRKRIGKSKLRPVRDGAKMLFSLVNVAYHQTSLLARMIMMPSLLIASVGFFFGIWSIYQFLKIGAPRPYYPLISTSMILVGIQLFSLGLIIDNLTKKLSRIEEKVGR